MSPLPASPREHLKRRRRVAFSFRELARAVRWLSCIRSQGAADDARTVCDLGRNQRRSSRTLPPRPWPRFARAAGRPRKDGRRSGTEDLNRGTLEVSGGIGVDLIQLLAKDNRLLAGRPTLPAGCRDRSSRRVRRKIPNWGGSWAGAQVSSDGYSLIYATRLSIGLWTDGAVS